MKVEDYDQAGAGGVSHFVLLFYNFAKSENNQKTHTLIACGLNGFMTHLISMAKLFIWQKTATANVFMNTIE